MVDSGLERAHERVLVDSVHFVPEELLQAVWMAIEYNSSQVASHRAAAVVLYDVRMRVLGEEFHGICLVQQTLGKEVYDVVPFEYVVLGKGWAA